MGGGVRGGGMFYDSRWTMLGLEVGCVGETLYTRVGGVGLGRVLG